MIRYVSQKQLPLEGFDTPPGMILDPNNRWAKLRDCLPWDELSKSYYKTLCSNLGRPAKDARIVIGAVIIKHKLSISDEETVEQIRENPYLQYFIGLKGFQAKAPFASSLLVEIRKRMGQTVFDEFHEAIIETVGPRRTKKSVKAIDGDNDGNGASNSGEVGSSDAATSMETEQSLADELPRNHGKLILDATVAEQAIRYPTDLGLLNEARELSERIIDKLHAKSNRPQKKKPRTYREIARKAYLSLVKLRRPSNRKRRAGIRQQLQFLQRNLNHMTLRRSQLSGTQAIRFSGKPLGRPPKITPENKDELMRLKAQRRQEYRERILIEGKYGYRLNNIRAKRADTSAVWINSIFLVMNLLILVRVFICLRDLAVRIAFGWQKRACPEKLGLRVPANSSQTGIFTWQYISDR